MKNLSPHRRFKGVRPVAVRIGSFSRNKWPEDLPKKCSTCGTTFVPGLNLEIGPSRDARTMKQTAVFATIPCWLGALFLPGKISSNILGILVFIILFTAPAVLIFIAMRLPVQRRVKCTKCGKERFYKLPAPPPSDDIPYEQ